MRKKINNNIILTLCVLVLAIICFLSVDAPIRFQKEQAKREVTVKQHLLKIRAAEEKYRKAHSVYTGDFTKLVKEGYLADSLRYIPFSGGKVFALTVSSQITKSGRQIPLMECSAGYYDYLSGLDENSVNNLIQKANETGRYPGLKIGDITTPNDNAGNWE